MASKRRKMFYENKKQETTEIGKNTVTLFITYSLELWCSARSAVLKSYQFTLRLSHWSRCETPKNTDGFSEQMKRNGGSLFVAFPHNRNQKETLELIRLGHHQPPCSRS
ncbi:hypothetical protein AAG570_012110 [Ranatra chinensis]|uniref:Uncharacterized protein n=1 Tax=Ranatra chinensis TaxID=642074 RepID=A0ABD0YI84_9HEMI